MPEEQPLFALCLSINLFSLIFTLYIFKARNEEKIVPELRVNIGTWSIENAAKLGWSLEEY